MRLATVLAVLLLFNTTFAMQDVWLYGSGSYKPDQEIVLESSLPPLLPGTLRLYRITNPEKVMAKGGPSYFRATKALGLEPLKSFKVRRGFNAYSVKTNLGTLPVGLYFAQLQLGNSKQKAATLISVSDLSLVVKSDADALLSYTAESLSGTPVKAKVSLMQGQKRYAEGVSDEQGVAYFSHPESSEQAVVVAAHYQNAWAFSDSYWNSWAVEPAKTYLQTDRPVYRPGQVVAFKGTARAPEQLRPLMGEPVEVIITDPLGKEVYKRQLVSDRYGSFSATLKLAKQASIGSYSYTATVRGSSAYQYFDVQAYQKPEYRVSVTSSKKEAVQGEVAHFKVKASYLFGGPVAGAKVTYALMRQSYNPWVYYGGFYDLYRPIYYPDYGGDIILRKEGKLNAKGELEVEVPLQETGEDYQLTLQAGVTDSARREISSSANLYAYRADLLLSAETNRYAFQIGETMVLKVHAKDITGRPVATTLKVETARQVWNQQTYQAKRVRGQTYQVATDAKGVGTLRLPADEQGDYILTVRGSDQAGRKTNAQTSAWVSGDKPWYWGYNDLSIKADKAQYQPGDEARFVIQSPVQDAFALITHEGQALGRYEVVKLKGSSLTYKVKVNASMSPNSYLGVVVVGGGQVYSQQVSFTVPPRNKFLKLKLATDKASYKPGEKGTIDVEVTDAQGQGVAAQLTLALVDEAIYLLRPDQTQDIRTFFYALRDNVVSTNLSDWYYFGNATPVAEDAAASPGGNMLRYAAAPAAKEASFAQSKAALAPAELREEFKDTLLWLPKVQTDKNGHARIPVTFPDNLTEWRLSVKAITAGDTVGQAQKVVKVTLPVIARLAAPRYFIKGDQAGVRVIAQNNLRQNLPGRIALEAENLTLAGDTQKALTFPANASASADFHVHAEHTGNASLSASALSTKASDALKQPLEVLPHGVSEERVWANRTNAQNTSQQWRFSLPVGADVKTATGTLYLTPSLAAAVSPALAYLAGYPYGCTEQTMSRFYPSVLAKEAGSLASLPPKVARELDKMVAQGLERLQNFQHDDGGWGFWENDTSDIYITSYVVLGLLDAYDAGYKDARPLIERALPYLQRALSAKNLKDFSDAQGSADGKAYAAYALAHAGKKPQTFLAQAGSLRLSAYGLALTALTYKELDDTAQAELYLDELLGKLTERGAVAYWEGGGQPYSWTDDRTQATAYGLLALSTLRPDDARLPKVVNWLLLNREGARWTSTKDTAAVIKAALALAATTGESAAEHLVTVHLNDQSSKTVRVTGNATESLSVPLAGFNRGANLVTVTVSGKTPLYLSGAVRFVAEQPAFAPENSGLGITRRYQKLLPVYHEKTATYHYRRVPIRGALQSGDYVLVTVNIKPKDAYRYLLVNDPLPAGFRVVEEDQAFRIEGMRPRYGWDFFGWNYYYDGRQIRDSQIDFYFGYLASPTTFTYILRAETPGRYSALPSHAWLMYEPEVSGRTSDSTLTISPDSAAQEGASQGSD